MRSPFITIEGPEGSGKSTQADLLVAALNDKGFKVKLTREPGGDPVSEDIRRILLDGADHSITDRAELLLYLAARAQHTENIVIPRLDEGFIVVCARYADSTVAYQGYGNGLDLEMIEVMNRFATCGLMPDITFLLDVDVEAGLKRQEEWNRMERKELQFHQRVRRGFLEIAKVHSERIVVIDASQDIETIQRQILNHLAERFGIVV